MLRAWLLVYPFLILYVFFGGLLFIPLTWIVRDIRPIYAASRLGVKTALFLSGVRVKTVNREHALAQPTALFVANHASNLDPPALFAVLPRIAVILKKELGQLPVLGYVMKLGEFVYVDRKDRESRHKALQAGIETLKRGISLLVFPEGTRSRDGKLLPFRPGPFTMAIEAGAPVVPITVIGARELMPRGTMNITPGTVTLVFHPAIATAELTSADRQGLIEEVVGITQRTLDEAG